MAYYKKSFEPFDIMSVLENLCGNLDIDRKTLDYFISELEELSKNDDPIITKSVMQEEMKRLVDKLLLVYGDLQGNISSADDYIQSYYDAQKEKNNT